MTRGLCWCGALLLAAAVATSCGGGGASSCSAPPAVNVTGSWSGTWLDNNGSSGTISFGALTQNAGAVEGQISFTGSPCFSGGAISGTVCGDQFSGSLSAGGIQVDVSATVTGVQMSGNFNAVSAGACTGDVGTFAASLG
jgi:hypothetical protein